MKLHDYKKLSLVQLNKLKGGITAEVTINKAKMADKAFNAMNSYISS